MQNRSKKGNNNEFKSKPYNDKTSHHKEMLMDYNPVFFTTSQDESVDVMWDWNSPQSKINNTKYNKKRIIHDSPTQIKRPVPIVSTQFEKLKEELRQFSEELKIPVKAPLDSNSNELDDVFNDSDDEELLAACQIIEDKLQKCKQPPVNQSPRTLLIKSFSSNSLMSESPIKKSSARKPCKLETKLKAFEHNDSSVGSAFDVSSIMSSQFDTPTKAADVSANLNNSALKFKAKSLSFESRESTPKIDAKLRAEIEERRRVAKLIKTNKTLRIKCDISKINSSTLVETSFSEVNSNNQIDMKQQIEENRRAALAKLQSKKLMKYPSIFEESDISILDSPGFTSTQIPKNNVNQIEENRKAALIKLQSKKYPNFPKNISIFPEAEIKISVNECESISNNDWNAKQQIEENRRVAMAKLQSKKSSELPKPVVSPIKNVNDEIEMRRQEAITKRDNKRKQQLIERNRQEALRKLEINRKRRLLSQLPSR